MSEALKVVIDLSEKVDCVLSGDNKVKSISAKGTLTVKNPSRRNKVWSCELQLGGVSSTSLKEERYDVGEVPAGGTWTLEYNIPVSSPLISLKETVDTYPKDSAINWAVAFNRVTPVRCIITLTNPSDIFARNIEVRKRIPKGFGDPSIEPPQTGSAEYVSETREVIWRGFDLAPGAEATLAINMAVKPEEVKPIGAGEVKLTYQIVGSTASSLTPDLYCISDLRFGVEPAESLSKPNFWDCTLEFLNTSDFMELLLDVEMSLVSDGRSPALSLSPNVELLPHQSWSYTFQVESPELPVFETKFNYRVAYEVKRSVYTTVVKEETLLPVMKVEAEKIFAPAEVDAYNKTPMSVTVNVFNVGSAELDAVSIIDTVPEDFRAPTSDKIKITLGDREITSGVTIALEPPSAPIEQSKTLKIAVAGLSKIGGFKPGQTMKVSYPVVAWGPKPKGKYLAPLRVTCNISPPGLEGEFLRLEEIPPAIEVKYARRAVKIFKESITPGAEKNQYVVPLIIVNSGEVNIENVTVKDFVPPGFKLVSWKPEELQPKVEETPDGLVLSWLFVRIEPKQEIQFSYVIEGSGRYVRKEPQITIGPLT
ncbi:MAG: hypothetical protein QXW47_07795 [Candidatus Jordarchaeales archaeon]